MLVFIFIHDFYLDVFVAYFRIRPNNVEKEWKAMLTIAKQRCYDTPDPNTVTETPLEPCITDLFPNN